MMQKKSLAALLMAACLLITATGCVDASANAPVATDVIDIVATPTAAPTPTPAPAKTDDPALGTPEPDDTEAPFATPSADPNVGVLPTPTPIPLDHIDPDKPMVALTFDDGPCSNTSRILDALELHSVRATFFVVGTQLEKYPEITARAAELGCEIGNHTYSHKNLTKISPDEMLDEIGRLNELIFEATGKEVSLVRPPYGAGIRDELVKATVPYPLIMWTIDTLDWSTRDTESTLKAIRKDMKDGCIVLMHDLYPATAAAVEVIIPELLEQGYQFVTVSELFAAKGIALENGKFYRTAAAK